MVLGVQSGTVMVKSIRPKRCRLVTSFGYSFVVRVYHTQVCPKMVQLWFCKKAISWPQGVMWVLQQVLSMVSQ